MVQVTVKKCAYLLKLDVALDKGGSVDPANLVATAGSPLPAMESPLHLGLRRVTRRAVAKRRSREAAWRVVAPGAQSYI